MRRVVAVIADGHRADFVRDEVCPTIMAAARSGTWFRNHRGIYPSATRASAASFATGCSPAGHGLHGNAMAFDEGVGPIVHDSGRPEFLDKMREVTGRTLAVPTTVERVARAFGPAAAAVCSNASPGAAAFNDPDRHGTRFHRSGSLGPGGRPLADDPALGVKKGPGGDRALTELFCEAVLTNKEMRYGVLWLSEPDTTMHASVLGSDRHLEAISGADRCIRLVVETVLRLRAQGDDVLLLLGSDHGQETVREKIPVQRLLIGAGLKEGDDSTDIAIAQQGSGAHVYFAQHALDRETKVHEFLRSQDWCGELFRGAELMPLGQRPEGGLRLSFSMRKYDEPNELGVPGVTDVVTSAAKPGKPEGFGSHGGLGAFERSPFLVANGGGFRLGREERTATSLLDIAPTALRHLGLPVEGVEGVALQPA
jgi:hypothetical protein